MNASKVRDHVHEMTRPMIGGYVSCQWCTYAQRERPVLAQEHSPTSKAAGASIEGSPRARSRAAVLEAIRNSTDGLTDERGQEITGLDGSTYRPRRVELVALGLVVDSKKVRMSKSGRSCAVWVTV